MLFSTLVGCGAAGGATEPSSDLGPVEHAYLAQAERRDVRYVRLRERRFAAQPSAEDIAAYQRENDEMLRGIFERNRERWTDMPPQIRARHILVRATGGEPEPALRVRAQQVRQRLVRGEDFATVAAAESADTGSAARGGDLGWFARGRMVAAFEDAAFALEPGQVSELVPTRFGIHIIVVTGRREGTLGYDEVAPELAELAARQRMQQRAMRLTAEQLRQAVVGGASLEDAIAHVETLSRLVVFERPVFLGVAWVDDDVVRERVAASDARGERWAERIDVDGGIYVAAVTRHEGDLADLSRAVRACIQARAEVPECDERYAEGPCDACVPEVRALLDAQRADAPRRRAD